MTINKIENKNATFRYAVRSIKNNAGKIVTLIPNTIMVQGPKVL